MADTCSIEFKEKLKKLYNNKQTAEEKLVDFEGQLDRIYREASEESVDPVKYLEKRINENIREIQIEANARMRQLEAYKKSQMQVDEFDDPVMGIESILHAQPGKAYKAHAGNIESNVNSIRNGRMGIVLRGFDNIEGGIDRGLSGEFDEWIYKIMKGEIDQADMGSVPREAIEIYTALKKHNDLDYKQKISVGANVKYRQGRLFKQRHSARNMEILGQNKWVEKAKKYFDNDEIINMIQSNKKLNKKYGESPDMVEAYLMDKYEDIQIREAQRGRNISDDFTSILFMGQKKSMEKQTTFKFKNAEAQMKYNMEVNGKSITSMVLEDIRDTSGYVGSAMVLGPNPRLGFQKLMQTYPIKSRTKLEKKFLLATGRRAGIADNMWAKSAEKLRKLSDITRLGTALFSTLPDFSLGAMVISANTGQNYFQTLGSLFKETFKNVRKGQRREVQKRLSVLMDDMLFGSMNTRIGEGGNMTNAFDNFSAAEWKKSIADGNMSEALRQSGNAFDQVHQKFMKYSGLPGQSEVVRTAIAKITAMGLKDEAGKSFADLYSGTRNLMERFNIGEREWDILRKIDTELEDGSRLIDTESILELDGEAVGMSNPADIRNYKEKLSANYASMLTFMAEHGSPTPGIKNKWWVDGFDPDTVSGQLLRFMGQYKSFSLSVVDTLREAYGPSFDMNRASKMGATMITGMGLAYIGTSAKNAVNGKDQPDPTSLTTWKDMTLKAGMGGLYADFLLTDYNSPWRSLPADVAGPGIGIAEDLLKIAKSPFDIMLADDERASKRAKKNLLRKLESSTPALPFTKTLINKNFYDMLHKTMNTGAER